MNRQDAKILRALPLTAVLTVMVGFALAWGAWPILSEMMARWSGDPRYSHGFLVPVFSAYVLWSRRGSLTVTLPSGNAWGLAWLAVGSAIGLAGTRYYLAWFEGLALVVSLIGLAVLAGGLPALSRAGPSIAFLIFMVPLPYRVETALGNPMQRAATIASTYALQTIGLPAVSEGNIILIDEAQIGVVEACNGLGMLLTFFTFATGVAMVSHRTWVDRVFIVASAAPIAFLANVSRITLTGVLHHYASSKAADAFYHDLAGWLMMPMALAAFGLELLILSHLIVDPPQRDAHPVVGLGPGLGSFAPSVARPATHLRGKS